MKAPHLLAATALLVALVPVSALGVDRKVIAIADGHNGTFQVDATGNTVNADYAEGAAPGRRIVLKFDISSLTDRELRGAVLRLHGGRGLTAPSPVDTRVFHYNFNQWNDSSPANIPYPSDSDCTFLASKNITDTTVNPAWQEFDIGDNLAFFWRSGPFLSLAVRVFTPDGGGASVSQVAFLSRNNVSDSIKPHLLIRTHSSGGQLSDGNFEATDWPGDWIVTSSGGSSAAPAANPYQADDTLAELVAGSPVTLEQLVDTPAEPYHVEFDYEFRATEGTLEVSLTNRDGETTVIGSLTAPASLAGALQTERILVDAPGLLGLDNARLSFTYDGPSGSIAWLDNIEFTETTTTTPAFEMWYDFEGETSVATDRRAADGAQDGTLQNNVTIQSGSVLHGGQSALFAIPDPIGPVNPPFSTIEIPGSTALGEDYTLAVYANNEEAPLDFTRLISSYRGTGPVFADRMVFDYDASGESLPGLRAIVNNVVVQTASPPAGMADPGYHHYAMTIDSGTVRLYFDGTEVASGNVGSGYTNALNLHIGKDPHDGGGSYDVQLVGDVDEVLVIDRTLSAAEIAQLAAGARVDSVVTPAPGEYAVYYDFEGNSGTTITDKFLTDGAQDGIAHQAAGVGDAPRLGDGSGRLDRAVAPEAPFSRIALGPVGNLGSQWTMSAAVNFPQAGHPNLGLTRLFSTYSGSGSAAGRLVFDFDPGASIDSTGVHLILPDGTEAIASDTQALNKLHTYTATYDDGDLRVYLDGAEVASASTSGDVDLAGFPLYLGEDDAFAVNENFIGTMDDAFIIQRVLSPAEVMQVHDQGASSVLQPTGYSQFSEPIRNVGLPDGFDEDADGDGLQNGLEYVLRTDPLDPTSGPAQLTGMTDVTGALGFRVPLQSDPSDVVLIVEHSTDLDTFEEIYRHQGATSTIAPDTTVVPDPGDANNLIIFGPNPEGPHEFYRFGVQLVAP